MGKHASQRNAIKAARLAALKEAAEKREEEEKARLAKAKEAKEQLELRRREASKRGVVIPLSEKEQARRDELQEREKQLEIWLQRLFVLVFVDDGPELAELSARNEREVNSLMSSIKSYLSSRDPDIVDYKLVLERGRRLRERRKLLDKMSSEDRENYFAMEAENNAERERFEKPTWT